MLLGPFGEALIAPTGVAAELPFRFSTKYADTETGLCYYGYRHYDPITGRWLSRDPIEEEGGMNLFGMIANDTVNFKDFRGLAEVTDAVWEEDPQGSPGGGTPFYIKSWQPLKYDALIDAKMEYPDQVCIGDIDITVRVNSIGNNLTGAFIKNLEVLPNKATLTIADGVATIRRKIALPECVYGGQGGRCHVNIVNSPALTIRLKGSVSEKDRQSSNELKAEAIVNITLTAPDSLNNCCHYQPTAKISIVLRNRKQAGAPYNSDPKYFWKPDPQSK